LAYHCTLATSVFRPYNVHHPGYNLLIGETREVTVDLTDPISKGCVFKARGNHKDDTRRITRGDRPKYYVKKRVASRQEGDDLAMFQYIASRRPLVKPIDKDPDELEDPDPDEIVHNNPNEFRTQLGTIFCEKSTLKGLLLPTNMHGKMCGVAETLVALCIRDTRDILDGVGNAVNKLDLDKEFPEGPQVQYSMLLLMSETLADSAIAIKERIRSQCRYVVKFEFGGRGDGGMERVKQYLRGARLAMFTYVIVQYNLCEGHDTWEDFGIDWVLGTDDAFTDIWENSEREKWYLCKEY
jgi:hypothetical protein